MSKQWGGEKSNREDYEEFKSAPTAAQMAIYKCGNCRTAKYVREDFAPPVLICLKCERPVKAQIQELNLRKHADAEEE